MFFKYKISFLKLSSYILIFTIFLFSCKKEEGCTDPQAFNYNPDAKKDDGSCMPIVFGCTNPYMFNYDPAANVDNGTCEDMILGCLDTLAMNFNFFANTSDFSCIYAYNLALGVWNISPDCDELEIPLVGTISLNDQLPETIEILEKYEDDLYIDINGQQVSGSIDYSGYVTVDPQTVQFDPGVGFALDIIVSGSGQINVDNSGSMDITYTFDIPVVGSQSINCNILLNK